MALISLYSCQTGWTIKSNSYVLTYYEFYNIKASKITFNTLNGIAFNTTNHRELGSADSKDPDEKAVFDAICEYYGDTSYNRKISGERGDSKRRFNVNDIIRIDVVSDSDFNESHPAGSSLNDILRFASISPMPYIESGYQKEYDWNNPTAISDVYSEYLDYYFNPRESTLHPVDLAVNDIPNNHLKLLGSGEGHIFIGFLIFTVSPTIAKEHNLNIVLTTPKGKLSCDLEYKF